LLAAAIAEQRFPRISAAVDVCNAVSLHAGLPINLLDADRLVGPLSIAPPATAYPFNPSGVNDQRIDLTISVIMTIYPS
jgi:DNA/RNA-binding domain of Phe-tRNA-synthetase-like protein